jgi:hypothetical protein
MNRLLQQSFPVEICRLPQNLNLGYILRLSQSQFLPTLNQHRGIPMAAARRLRFWPLHRAAVHAVTGLDTQAFLTRLSVDWIAEAALRDSPC